jgi:hypothetical protein
VRRDGMRVMRRGEVRRVVRSGGMRVVRRGEKR